MVNKTPKQIKRKSPTRKEVRAECEDIAQFLFDLYQQRKLLQQ